MPPRTTSATLRANPASVPLHLTAKERSTLAMILGLLVLGLIGMAVLRDDPAPSTVDAPAIRPATARDRATSPRP